MKKMRYITLFSLLLTVDAFGMNNSNSNNQELLGSKRTYGEMADNNNNDDDNNVEFPINILMPRNARGTSTELLSLSDAEPITFDSFRDLMEAKHNVKDSYILARVLTESGSFVQYFDANTLNRALFNQYPFGDLKELNQYRNPCSRLPIDKLDYYQCEPTKKTFEYWCSYADLSNADNPNGDRNIYRMMFYANQTDNLVVAAREQCNLAFLKGATEEAVKLYTRAANQTDDLAVAARAQFNLALLKEKSEPEEGVRLCTRAAQQTADLAVAAIAQCRLAYLKEKSDPEEAMRLYREVANQTANLVAAAKAQFNLALLKEKSEPEEAVRLHTRAANQDADLAVAAKAQFGIACLKAESDPEGAMRLYKEVANQTAALVAAAKAQFNLALLKEKSEPEEAVEWYTRAANQTADLAVAGEAQCNLGCIYGRALKYAKAKELFEKAVAKKNVEAKSNIALLYLLGHGVDKDLNEAVELLLSVANQIEDLDAAAFAQNWLGCIYLFKSEVRDYERAQAYLNQVINQTENESAVAAAKNALAWMSWHGKGVPQDIEQAKKYYTEVSQQSNDNQAVIAKISLKQIEALQKQEANV
jgi:TPR repeat protein